MSGATNLKELLKTLQPEHIAGDFVFCVVDDPHKVNLVDVVMLFKEQESYTIIIRKELADSLGLLYSFVAAMITLTVHSSLAAVGLTASFSKALADNGISCNVVAGFYHDHIFVDKKDIDKAMRTLRELSK